jgi:SNF2 family DNA or RNA helicase
LSDAQLAITSYGALARDVEQDSYAHGEFSLVIADEASLIRNPNTRAAKALRSLKASARLALSGTPVENSIEDLWSIMEFAEPGYLGSRSDFTSRYGRGGEGDLSRLRRRINPFVLRRVKSEVASDLPSKSEQIVYCELTPTQRKTYEFVLKESRKNVSDLLSKNAENASNRLEILTALLRLRQICCDMRLLPGAGKTLSKSKQPDILSAKLDVLRTLLERAVPAGHRVLVFSQFVGMLQLVREHLAEWGYQFAYLDGASSSKQRAEQVDAFQAPDSEIPVFLISLKAGGYGLTLTAADTVIHLDPWWNPAVEAQATDRAHRIGQTRPVTSYKLITTGTVEEKIVELQKRKRQVISAALDDVQPLMSELKMNEIAELLG